MTHWERINWFFVAAALLASGGALLLLPLQAEPSDYAMPLLTASGLAIAGHCYRLRRREVAICCIALAQIVIYTACYTVLMYAVGTIGGSLVDGKLATIDAYLGIHLPSIVEWSATYPTIASGLHLFYDSMILQTAAVIALLGLGGREGDLNRFGTCFFASTALCLFAFCFYPAAGPFEYYGYAANEAQIRYLEHLQGLRDGTFVELSWRGAEGMITFPSFHTTWAILLVYAVRNMRPALLVLLPINICVVLATLTTGWHYGIDVVGGSLLAGIVVAVVHASLAPQPQRGRLLQGELGNTLSAAEISRPSAADMT